MVVHHAAHCACQRLATEGRPFCDSTPLIHIPHLLAGPLDALLKVPPLICNPPQQQPTPPLLCCSARPV